MQGDKMANQYRSNHFSLVFFFERISPKIVLVKKVQNFNDTHWFTFTPDCYRLEKHEKFVIEAGYNSKRKKVKICNLRKNEYEMYYKDNTFHFRNIPLIPGILI